MLIEFEKYGHGKGLVIRIYERSLSDSPIAERLYEPPPAWFQSEEQYVAVTLPDPNGPEAS